VAGECDCVAGVLSEWMASLLWLCVYEYTTENNGRHVQIQKGSRYEYVRYICMYVHMYVGGPS
jgi:hypothetical protein